MSPLIFVFIGVIILATIALAVFKAKLGEKTTPGGVPQNLYTAQAAIFSAAERSFAGVLDGVLPDGTTWFGKVRLGDVFETRKGLSLSQQTAARNRINQKHVDFLLVRAADFAPLAGVELDDSSHQRADRKTRDAFVDAVFRSGNLPLLHIPTQAAYNASELRAKIAAILETKS